jgi:hypothetical protein
MSLGGKNMGGNYLDVGQLAQRWHLATGTLDHWRLRGNGPLFMKIGGKVLYRLSDVEAFESANVRQETKKDTGVEIHPSHWE